VADLYPEPMQAGQKMLDTRLGPVDEERQTFLRKAAFIDQARLARYATAETYYDGLQTTYLTDRAKTYLEANGIAYQENFCEVIVDAMVERLSVVGVRSDSEVFDAWVWTDWWDHNEGDVLQLTVHTEAAKKGDAFVILEWSAKLGRVCAHFNRPELMNPVYREGRLMYVAKVWDSEAESPTNPTGMAVRRMNLYYPDRVEKWFATSSGDKAAWGRWLDDTDTEWPVAWTYEGKPLGIPVIHFANKARGDHFGRPEHLGAIPQQNRLNKELLDLSMVLDQLGFPQRYAIGVGDTSGLKNAPGEVWRTDSTDGTFGQFDAANPAGPLAAIEATLVRMGTRSNTPAHRFTLTGGYPSGEALKVAEAGLTAKARNRHTVWGGGPWAATFRMAAALTIVYGAGSGAGLTIGLDELMRLSINPTWADPESRNEKEHLETLGLMHGLGVSKQTLLTMMPGIDATQEMKLREQEEDAMAERQARVMDAGLPPPSIAGGVGGPER